MIKKFIEKSNKIHNSKYSYDKVTYINSLTKVVITCPEHGDFEQVPSSHTRGRGCPICAGNSKLDTKDFISKAANIHNNKYDYSSTTYINSSTMITIICLEHGEFKQLPHNHLNTKGCPKCGRLEAASKYTLYSEEEIFAAAKTCATRGEFQNKFPKLYMASVSRDIYEKACLHMEDAYNKLKTNEQFQLEVYSLVEDEYSLVETYINRITKIKFKHNICGHIYKTTPKDFLQGRICPNCVTSGFNPNKPAILYYLKVYVGDIEAYKIGITNLTVSERYSLTELSCITVIFEINYEFGKTAYLIEQKILKEFADLKYKGLNLLKTGNTELFIKDITKHENFNNIVQVK